MADRPVRWTWTGDRKVEVQLVGGQPKEFTLLPIDRKRVERFRNDLALARSVTIGLLRGRESFEKGTAEYTNAARRLKKLNIEFGKALDEQLTIASEVRMFFVPNGIDNEFLGLVDALTQFCAETIERLFAPAPAPPSGTPPPPPHEAIPPTPPAAADTEPELEPEDSPEPVVTE